MLLSKTYVFCTINNVCGTTCNMFYNSYLNVQLVNSLNFINLIMTVIQSNKNNKKFVLMVTCTM